MNSCRVRVARGGMALLVLLLAFIVFPSVVLGAADSVAFVRDGDIWTISPDGSDARQLTSTDALDRHPAWSSDHTLIAFVRHPSDGSGRPRICLIPAAGGTPKVLDYRDTLRTTYRYISDLAFSPNGTRLAFSDGYGVSGSPYTHNRVVVIRRATGTTRVLARRSRGLDTAWRLSWSSSGKTILVGQIGQSSEMAQAWRLNVARGGLSALGIADAAVAAWSPNGKRIVVSTENQTRTRVKLASAAGKVLRVLATGDGWFSQPRTKPTVGAACFSPSGSQIAYERRDLAAETAVWIMNADGTGKRQLTVGEEPAWR